MAGTGIGDAVRRVEDYRFLTGRGNYTDDINVFGQAYAYILRSPHAHAAIRGIDTAAAAAAPGVVAVFTGADVEADGLGGVPCGWQVTDRHGNPMIEPPHPILVSDRVRHVGDQVAVVIAESLAAAKDAAELIAVDYDVQAAMISTAGAGAAGAPQVWDDAKQNVCYDWELGDQAEVEATFAEAAHVASVDIVNNRLIANAIEPRAALGHYDAGKDHYTLHTTAQAPHVVRLLMGAYVLQVPEHKLRVNAPDVGGGFGSKIYHYAEEAIVTWASKKVGRPVKWTAERSDSFISDAHGRDHVSHAELALDAEGKFLAMRVSTIANMGAYLSTFAPAIPTYLYALLLAGVYTTPKIHCEVKPCSPTPSRSTPIAAPAGRRRPSWSSGWSTRRRGSPGSM